MGKETEQMKHFGDITRIDGHSVPPVDVVTGGSPCQDLSVAGKRQGLSGARSGLFMEQIRIIKEMRENDKNNRSDPRADDDFRFLRPRFMVWENVPGAFSSNGGEDFRAVLEETARIADLGATIPRPKNGKWAKSGCILGNGFSIAWRLHDSKYWGVPQRRKRIALVADFGGETAPEILFEFESVSGDSQTGRSEGKAAARDPEDRTRKSSCRTRSIAYGISPKDSNAMKSLTSHGDDPTCNQGGTVIVSGTGPVRPVDAIPIESHPQDGRIRISADGNCQTLASRMGTGGNNVPLLIGSFYPQMKAESNCWTTEGISPPIVNGTNPGFHNAICIGNGQLNQISMKPIANTIDTMHDQQMILSQDLIVRRITPKECERLQGFPDDWTNIGEWTDSKGKRHKNADAPRYKALGNSIALPFWDWMAKRMMQYLPENPTMASLFDGIGGFPLVFSRNGCDPVWASEIEEFPIAVTKIRFPEREGASDGI